MECGLWPLLFGNIGCAAGFNGWFDEIMVLFFYVPNLIVAEMFIRAGRKGQGAVANFGAVALLLVASAFVIAVTWIFTANATEPKMVSSII